MNVLYKTRMCNYQLAGKCRHGIQCLHAHSEAEIRPFPDFRKTKLCRMFQKGYCTNTNCNRAHGEKERRVVDSFYKTKMCKYWKDHGTCIRGLECYFAHDERVGRLENEILSKAENGVNNTSEVYDTGFPDNFATYTSSGRNESLASDCSAPKNFDQNTSHLSSPSMMPEKAYWPEDALQFNNSSGTNRNSAPSTATALLKMRRSHDPLCSRDSLNNHLFQKHQNTSVEYNIGDTTDITEQIDFPMTKYEAGRMSLGLHSQLRKLRVQSNLQGHLTNKNLASDDKFDNSSFNGLEKPHQVTSNINMDSWSGSLSLASQIHNPEKSNSSKNNEEATMAHPTSGSHWPDFGSVYSMPQVSNCLYGSTSTCCSPWQTNDIEKDKIEPNSSVLKETFSRLNSDQEDITPLLHERNMSPELLTVFDSLGCKKKSVPSEISTISTIESLTSKESTIDMNPSLRSIDSVLLTSWSDSPSFMSLMSKKDMNVNPDGQKPFCENDKAQLNNLSLDYHLENLMRLILD